MTVLVLPASDRADEVAAEMLAKVLRPLGFDVEVPPAATLKGEMLARVDALRPQAIVVSAAPPAAVVHARYLGKRLAGHGHDATTLVGLWDAQGDLTKATQRLTTVGLGRVATSAAAIVDALNQLRQPLLQGIRSREDRVDEVLKEAREEQDDDAAAAPSPLREADLRAGRT